MNKYIVIQTLGESFDKYELMGDSLLQAIESKMSDEYVCGCPTKEMTAEDIYHWLHDDESIYTNDNMTMILEIEPNLMVNTLFNNS
jgi:hypothetical protein